MVRMEQIVQSYVVDKQFMGSILVAKNGNNAITHGGGINGFNTFMIYFPKDKLTIIILANLIAVGFVPQSLGLNIAELVYNKVAIPPS